MTIVERLQTLAKEKGTNFKQLEADCGIGNPQKSIPQKPEAHNRKGAAA